MKAPASMRMIPCLVPFMNIWVPSAAGATPKSIMIRTVSIRLNPYFIVPKMPTAFMLKAFFDGLLKYFSCRKLFFEFLCL